MADLIGIQISDLPPCPSLADTTNFAVQRAGVQTAEKASLAIITSFVLGSSNLTNTITSIANARVSAHTTASDPHGDRAFTTLSLNTHTGASDPHGDRAYADSKINSLIPNHIAASDPHGDRAFTTTQINNHKSAADPHGDRAYSDNKINEQIAAHKGATDPHGDRAYSKGLVDTHISANDPHGDRAYIDMKIAQIDSTSPEGVELIVNEKIQEKIGEEIAPVIGGLVPESYLPSEVITGPFITFPSTGKTGILYVDSTNNDIYRWDGISFKNLTPAINIDGLDLTTDVVEVGTNPDRQYFTSAIKAEIDSKISKIFSSTSGTSLIKEETPEKEIELYSLNARGELEIEKGSGDIIIKDNNFSYKGESSDPVITLETDRQDDPLKSYSEDFIYFIQGEVTAYKKEEASGIFVVTENNNFLIDAQIGLLGVTQAVPKVTSASFNSTGSKIEGTGLPNSSVSIYDNTFTFLTDTAVNAVGSFSHTFASPKDKGEDFYLYTKLADGSRSGRLRVTSPNLTDVRGLTGESFSKDGLKYRGITEKNSTISLKIASSSEELSPVTSNNLGFFEVTLDTPLTEGDNLEGTLKTSLGVEEEIYSIEYEESTVEPAYNIIIDRSRTKYSGKTGANLTVQVLSTSLDLLGVTEADEEGSFNGVFSEGVEVPDTIIFKTTSGNLNSKDIYLKLLDKIELKQEPVEIPVLTDSEFGFISKVITKSSNVSSFGLELKINQIEGDIELELTNSTGKSISYRGNLRIRYEEI